VLRATRERPNGLSEKPVAPFYPTGASSLATDEGSAANLMPPVGIADGNVETAWVTAPLENGRSQFVTLKGTPGAFRIAALKIVSGHGLSPRAFTHFGRPHRLMLLFDHGPPVAVELPRETGSKGGFRVPSWVLFPEPLASSCVTLVIDGVDPGVGPSPTGAAIAEVTVYSEADLSGDRSPLERVVAELARGTDTPALHRMVVAQGTRAEPVLHTALRDAAGLGRILLLEALAEVGTAASAQIFALALSGSERESRAAARGLKRLGHQAVPALTQVMLSKEAVLPLRIAAAIHLGAVCDEAAAQAFVRAMAEEPQALRDTIAASATRCAGNTLLRAVLAALERPSHARHLADLLRLLAIAVPTSGPEDRRIAADTLRMIAQKPLDFEGRYRLARASGALADERTLDILRMLLASKEPEIREATVLAAGDFRCPAAVEILRQGLRDTAPEVRRASLHASLRQKGTLPAHDIVTLLRKEPWPFVRHEAIRALAASCREALALVALREATQDRDSEVARAAVQGLVKCQDKEALPRLLALLENPRCHIAVREAAALGLGRLEDRSAAARMARVLDEIREQPESDDRAEGLAVTLVRTLATLKDPVGVPALKRAAADTASPRLRATALRALGELCSPGTHALLEAAQADTDARVRTAAREAAMRCRQ